MPEHCIWVSAESSYEDGELRIQTGDLPILSVSSG